MNLADIINDPEQLKLVQKYIDDQLSPQQKYMRTDKGKEAKRRSNQKYKSTKADPDAFRNWIIAKYADRTDTDTEHYTITDFYELYNGAMKMMEFKRQLIEFGISTATSYLLDGKRVHRQVYVLHTPTIHRMANINFRN